MLLEIKQALERRFSAIWAAFPDVPWGPADTDTLYTVSGGTADLSKGFTRINVLCATDASTSIGSTTVREIHASGLMTIQVFGPRGEAGVKAMQRTGVVRAAFDNWSTTTADGIYLNIINVDEDVIGENEEYYQVNVMVEFLAERSVETVAGGDGTDTVAREAIAELATRVTALESGNTNGVDQTARDAAATALQLAQQNDTQVDNEATRALVAENALSVRITNLVADLETALQRIAELENKPGISV